MSENKSGFNTLLLLEEEFEQTLQVLNVSDR